MSHRGIPHRNQNTQKQQSTLNQKFLISQKVNFLMQRNSRETCHVSEQQVQHAEVLE